MTSIIKDDEIINLIELESNSDNGNKILCPKCGNDTVVKRDYHVDLPKTVGFAFFLGASFTMVLILNAIVMIRSKMKMKKLPNEIKKRLEENKKMSFLGLNIPTKMRISCNKCEYIFYENYDSGDMIVVFVLFILFIASVFVILFVFLK